MMKLKNKKKGFTLIELIIVIAIIAILAAVAIPKFGEVRKNANRSADIANAKTVANAINTLIAEDKLKLPSSEVTFLLDGKDETNQSALLANSTTSNVEAAIVDYMQANPTAKLSEHKGSNFTVVVTTKGNVTVKLIKAGTGAENTGAIDSVVYPEQTPTAGSLYYPAN